ncbi:DUF421 domain-containing protein [Xinfangfangia pollutisoli]|uniref:DUF421 domain-containing protein n=1 Tax=Xinfangfangia pollutisoli TaxID=2865960 RepID=UPI001CD3C5FD|nr:YetF domain-containing protein [Xinfangfangia pollutisoli]
MQDLWQMSAPWWHFVLRGVVIYALVTLLLRVSGKRAIGQFTPFDMILLILIGNAVQNGINGGDNSLTGAAIMAVTLIGLNYLVALGSARSRWIRGLAEGNPTLLAENGKVDQQALRRELVSNEDFLNAMRIAGCSEVAHIKRATLETNGHILIEPHEDRRG